MMEQLNAVLGTLSYVPAVMAGVFVACGRTERKKYYWLWVLLCGMIICLLRHTIIQHVRASSFSSQGITTLANSAVSVMTCVLCTLAVWPCYQKRSGWQLLYYGITGFSIQFITHKIYELLQIFFTFNKPVETMIVALITVTGYVIAWKKLFSKLDTEAMARRRSMQIAIAVICIYVNFFVRLDIFSSSVPGKLAVWFLSVAAMASILLLQVNILFFSHVSSERDTLLQLVEQQRKQYDFEQHTIEMINIKCHDMRHMLREKGDGMMDGTLLNELAEQISFYDTRLNTGCEALTVLLAKYGMDCEREGIRLTCMLDGSPLQFIPPYKIYAMFGNALENAVKAVRGLPQEKRVISISGQTNGDLLNIRVANYYNGRLEMENGLPVNHEENHGFGVKSIQLIAQEFGGNIHVQCTDDLFILHILLPLPAEKTMDDPVDKK